MKKRNKRILIVLGILVGYSLIKAKTPNINPNSNDSDSENTDPIDQPSKNVEAFLNTIQYAEGTFNQPNPYAVTFGYDHIIRNFSDHPAITGEWNGKILSDNFCAALNLPSGCKSTAAGAYQIIKPTWEFIKGKDTSLSFDVYSQNKAAIDLIKGRGAYIDIQQGRFVSAINKLNREWASLPNSPYGQPTRNMDELQIFYYNQGGRFSSV